MFLPSGDGEAEEEKKAQRVAMEALETLTLKRIPAEINRDEFDLNLQEVQCGDPECAPIDTAVYLMFKSGGKTAFGIPMTMAEVTDEVLDEYFPPEDYIRSWHEGDDVDWPPPYDESDDENADEGDLQQVPLRFNIGDAVECRIGADPVTGWAGGKVAMLWYRESNWPKNSKAPYQVQLDDGKLIFAPVDKNEVIRAKQS